MPPEEGELSRRPERSGSAFARTPLPRERGYKSRPAFDNRQSINGILLCIRTGAPWRDLPEKRDTRAAGSPVSSMSQWCPKHPAVFHLTPGEAADCTSAERLFTAQLSRPRPVLRTAGMRAEPAAAGWSGANGRCGSNVTLYTAHQASDFHH